MTVSVSATAPFRPAWPVKALWGVLALTAVACFAAAVYCRALEGRFAEIDQDRRWKTLAQQGVSRLSPPRSGSAP